MLLGALYIRRNEFDQASREYRRIISMDPRAADAYEGLAQASFSSGRFADAVRDSDMALAINPALQSSRYLKAMALIRDGREGQGRAVLDEYQQRASDLQTSESKVSEVREISIKSSALLYEKRPQEALDLLREALRSHPLNASLYRTMGLAQSVLGLHREAIGTFETLVRLTPTDFLVHRELASEYELIGNQDMARQQRVIYLQKLDIALLPN
jgi:tetratricopeptide (TPR) repeat protein